MNRMLQTIFAVSLALSLSGCGKKDDAKKDDKAGGKSKTMEEKAKDAASGMIDVFKKNKDDCDKLGTEFEKWVNDNKALMKELEAHEEKLTGDEKKKFKDVGKPSEADEEVFKAGIIKCMDNDKMKKAMEAMDEAVGKKGKKDEPKGDEPKKDEEEKKEE